MGRLKFNCLPQEVTLTQDWRVLESEKETGGMIGYYDGPLIYCIELQVGEQVGTLGLAESGWL